MKSGRDRLQGELVIYLLFKGNLNGFKLYVTLRGVTPLDYYSSTHSY